MKKIKSIILGLSFMVALGAMVLPNTAQAEDCDTIYAFDMKLNFFKTKCKVKAGHFCSVTICNGEVVLGG